uniref:RING-type domain-containing protein n=1 Tax=Macrostomum lignano TaxID=282301 RepID=A0A1I8J1H8_9PLAT
LEDNGLQGKLELLISADSQSLSSYDSLSATAKQQQQQNRKKPHTKQALQWCLDASDLSPMVGAVSALDFSYDMRKLLVGYARGHLTLWDTRTGKRLMHIADAHPPGSAVLHVRYTLASNLAVFSDSSGSVYRLAFGRQLTRRTVDSACLFSGSRGEICTLAPLSLPPKLMEHPIAGASLLAMASFTKLFLVRLLPELAVVNVEPLPGKPGTLPQICWQVGCCGDSSASSASRAASSAGLPNPFLVFGRDDVIKIARVSQENSPSLSPTSCGIRVQTIRQLSLSNLGLSSLLSLHFLHSSTAVVCDQRERLCVVDVDAGRVLETESLNPVQLVYNTAAFKALATGSNVSQALAYAADSACYHSVRAFEGQLVIIGATTLHIYRLRNWEERLMVLKQRRLWPELFKLAGDLYAGRAPAVIGLSRKADQRRLAVQPRVRALLEEYLAEALQSQGEQFAVPIDEAQQAADLSLTACHRTEQLDWLFNVTSFNTNDILKFSWQRGLYDAIVYVHTVAMGDPVTPLKQLLDELKRRQSDSLTNEFDASFQQLGGKCLVHLSACLAGQPYFAASDLPSNASSNAQLNVFALLVNKCAKTGRFDNLEALCRFSIGDLLNFLALAFQENFFAGDSGLARKQELLDDLIATVADGRGFSPGQVGALFSFLVKLLVQPHSAGLQFPARVFDQVLEYLCNKPERPTSDTSEQQAAVIALLNSGRLSASATNSDRLLTLATEAGFHRVRSHLYLERREFAPVIECMLLDEQRAPAVFDYVAELTTGQQLPEDASKTVLLVTQHLGERLSNAARRLADQPSLCYSLLGAYFSMLRQEDRETAAVAAAAAAATASATVPISLASSAFALPRDDEDSLTETYLRLMASEAPARLVDALQSGLRFNPKALIKHLDPNSQAEAQAICYELANQPDRALDVLLNRLDAAWNSSSASTSADDRNSAVLDWLGKCADTCSRAAARLQQDDSKPADAAAAEQLWFQLLDRVLQRARRVHVDGNVDEADKDQELVRLACRNLVARMTAGSGVSLPSVLRRLLSDPAYTADRVGELLDLLVHLLDSCRYESTLLATCAGLVGRDANLRLLEACQSARRAAVANGDAGGCCCANCGLRLDEASFGSSGGSNGGVLLFRGCGHACHSRCVPRGGSVSGSPGSIQCPSCTPLGANLHYRRNSPGATAASTSSAAEAASSSSSSSVAPAAAAASSEDSAIATSCYFRLAQQLRTPDRSEFFESIRLLNNSTSRSGLGRQQQQQTDRVSSAVPLRLSPATPAWL